MHAGNDGAIAMQQDRTQIWSGNASSDLLYAKHPCSTAH
jgi:hypothetical protein